MCRRCGQYLFAETAQGGVGYTPLGMIVAFAPLAMLFGSMFFMKNPTAGAVNLLYWAVVATIGAGLGVVFLVYTGTSIASTFFVTAAAFGALSLWGYTTKKDMSGWGTFLIMGVIGLVIAMVVNMFLQNPMMYFVINALGVLIFSGLIAYRHPAPEDDLLRARRRQGRHGRGHRLRRPGPVHQFREPVPVPAGLHGRA